MSRKMRRGLIIGLVSIIGVVLIVLLPNIILNKLDQGFVFYIGNRQIIKLGNANNNVFPSRIESAFTKTTDATGESVRIAKYIDNVIVDHETEGVVFATQLNSTDQRRYRFSIDTSYICAAPNMRTVDIPQKVDPKKDLAHYMFLFQGDLFRGKLAPDALNNFRQDLNDGDAASKSIRASDLTGEREC